MANNGPGGFVPNPLPSPAPSQASSTATFRFTDDLPNSRSHPLQPGSQKETAFINYVDTRILNINRRYAKKFTGEIEEGAGRGYDNFTDVVRDLQSVLDVVWVSGTPDLQVPYLLSLATLLCSYLPAFPLAPDPTFYMIAKLDKAFSNLLRGSPITPSTTDTRRRLVSLTDQVRIRSVIEVTRVSVVDMLSNHHQLDMQNDETDVDIATGDELERRNDDDTEMPSHYIQSASQLYINTLDLLGDSLISEDRERD